MKLKMSENSLFAVLLRSPWWISFAVMLVFALAATALLPKDYVPFGVMGAFPFLVIGCIAAWRQWHAPSAASLEGMLTRISAMPWREFASTVEAACQSKGYSVTGCSEPGADFRLEKAGKTSLLSAKRWKAANLGVDALRDLAAAMTSADADTAYFLSLTPVSPAAQQFAKAQGIALISGGALAQWLLK